MIAGGTGIAPMNQIIETLLMQQKSDIQLTLLFSNVVEEDILLRQQLETIQSQNPEKFKIHYTLTNPQGNWTQFKGRIDKEKIQECFPAPSDQTLILVCGPIIMTNSINLLLHEMGYQDRMIFLFL